MTPLPAAQAGAEKPAGASLPEWLGPDMERVEKLLVATAGASKHPLVAEPATHLIEAGGKRMRPALVLLSSHAGEPGSSSTDLAAAAVELVHLATLYHDDVMDETEVRRGVPTTHAKWGVEIAVLAGDYLFACGSSLGAEAGGEVPGILAGAIAEVCEGQIIETASLNDPARSLEDYLETIERKTGALFRAACELGATTSGAPKAAQAALGAYGSQLGLAFQMVDDLLDLIGDAATIGKTPGTDLREGVFTLAVIVACESDPSLRARLASGDRALANVLPILEATGALEAAREEALRTAQGASEALATLPRGPWTEALDGALTTVLAQLP